MGTGDGDGEEPDPVAAAVSVLSKKWHPAIIQLLLEEQQIGFNDIQRELSGISAKVLSNSLENLGENGLVERTVVNESPLRVKYSLTHRGEQLEPAIEELREWGIHYLGDAKPKVLIVDNDARITEMHATWLDGYDVRTAHSGSEALERLDPSFDAILLDRRMHGITGDDVIREIRDRQIDCRVALLSALDPDFDIVDLDVDDYVSKPGTREEIRETVEDLVARNEYDATTRQYLALRSKRRVLRDVKTPGALASADAYQRLEREIAELREQLDDVDAIESPRLTRR